MARYSLSDGTINFPGRATDPATPSAGRYKLYVDNNDGQPKLIDDSGTVITFQSIFGQNASFSQDDTPVTNNTNANQVYITCPYGVGSIIPAAIYRVFCSFTWGYSAGNRDFIGELFLNGTQLTQDSFRQEPKDTGADQRNAGKIGPIFLTGSELIASSGNFTFEYRATSNGDVARLYFGAIEFYRWS